MKLKRFTAPDMRQALAKIRAELGADAVIMSNQKTSEGIEIIAGIEEPQKDPNLLDRLKDDEVSLSLNNKTTEKKIGGEKASGFAQSLIEILERQSKLKQKENTINSLSSVKDVVKKLPEPSLEEEEEIFRDKALSERKEGAQVKERKARAPKPLSCQDDFSSIFKSKEQKESIKEISEKKHGISSYKDDSLDKGDETLELKRMKDELYSIRKLLQFELAGLLSDNRSRKEPVRAMTYELLKGAGLSDKLSQSLSQKIDADASFNFAWRQLSEIISDKLQVGQDEIINEGGIVTLVGPAGVGKTTTLAKLAARFVMKYGPEQLAIVTADHYRIGAVEQIKTYGRIMGCTALAVKSYAEIPKLLLTLGDKSLVLIDTVGVGLNDERFGTQLAQLKQQSQLKMRHYLVLPATAQRRVLEQVYSHFSDISLTGLILTKIDESLSLGDALSVCLERDLCLSYVACGQRVPEDLKVPSVREMTTNLLSSIENDAVRQIKL